MMPTIMAVTHRTMLLTARCKVAICGLFEYIGFHFGGACLLTTFKLHHSLATIECQHLTFIDKR
jgi:hypothetical protein